MKKLVLLTLALTSLALGSSCSTKNDIFKYTITTDVNEFYYENVIEQFPRKIDIESNQIEILIAMNSLNGQYPVKYDLDCEGDGEFEYKGLTDNKKCIYKKNSGKHQIWVRGEIPAMFLCARRLEDEEINCSPDARSNWCDEPIENDHSSIAVVSIDSWGNVSWKSMFGFASECFALKKLPEDSPDLSHVKDMSSMFAGTFAFNQPLEAWDVSNVTDMHRMFAATFAFNQPLEAWDVSNVTDMHRMFLGAFAFNQPLGKWDVSNVTRMDAMFMDADSFNQPLDKWNVSNVTQMVGMFSHAKSFNQPLGKWNVSHVTDMSGMFYRTDSFNQPLDKWDVSNVTDMREMFKDAKAFSHYPKNWVVPADKSEDMFTGTKVEAEASKSPLKTK